MLESIHPRGSRVARNRFIFAAIRTMTSWRKRPVAPSSKQEPVILFHTTFCGKRETYGWIDRSGRESSMPPRFTWTTRVESGYPVWWNAVKIAICGIIASCERSRSLWLNMIWHGKLVRDSSSKIASIDLRKRSCGKFEFAPSLNLFELVWICLKTSSSKFLIIKAWSIWDQN